MENQANPFASPQTASQPRVPEETIDRPIVPYESGHTLALWTMGLLATCVVLDLVAVGSTYLQIQLLNQADQGQVIAPAVADSNDSRQAVIGIVQVALFLVTGICFLMWIHRAHRNLPALGAQGLKYTPGWTVAYFFIPILNLFRPYQATSEIWRASDPTAEISERSGWSEVPTPNILPLWWTFWLAATVLGRISGRFALEDSDLKGLITGSWITLASDLAQAVAGVLLLLVVRGIDRNQTEKAKNLGITSGRKLTFDDSFLTSN